jgi:ATP-binding cassette subfamily F protein uup
VHHGTNVQIAYFDQQREQLDPERTVVDTVADGNDTVTVGGVTRHVHGYLEDFLFAPERARSPVKALSGGERNRLLLARLLTRPANVLVLDDRPTISTSRRSKLLEAELVAFPGTILIVSHDRRFLNNVITSTLAFEGDGRVQEYVGGYDDWLAQRPQPVPAEAPPAAAPKAAAPPPARKKNVVQGAPRIRSAAGPHRRPRIRARGAPGEDRESGVLQRRCGNDQGDDGSPGGRSGQNSISSTSVGDPWEIDSRLGYEVTRRRS